MAKKLRWKVVIAMLLCCVAGIMNGGVREVKAATYDYEVTDGWMYYIQEDGTLELVNGGDEGTELIVPSEIGGIPVTKVSYYWVRDNLTRVVIPEGVTCIGETAFDGCKNLTDVVIPSTVTEIGGNAFRDTPWLENKRKENSLVIINNILLDGRTASGVIDIPLEVTSIADSAFQGCSNLQDITIPSSVSRIGTFAFTGTSWLAKKQRENPLVVINDILIDGKTASGDVVIPDNVMSISGGAFYDSGITSVTIPEGITCIEEWTFGYSSLEGIILPASVKRIDDLAFASCYDLKEIMLSEGLESIGEFVFEQCNNLKEITVPSSLAYIEKYSYLTESDVLYGYENSQVEEYTDIQVIEEKDNLIYGLNPNSDTVIIIGCKDKNIQELSIPSEINGYPVTRIGVGAFMGCANLNQVELSSGVTDIGYGAFAGCDRLKNIVIPSGVTRIGARAFSDCSSLRNVPIPLSVTEIGAKAFEQTPWLADRRKQSPLVVVNNIVIDGTTVSGDVTIPSGITRMTKGAFSENKKLTGITIPEGITEIEDAMFFGCSNLKEVTIPEGVTTIGACAFSHCSSLEYIDIPASVETMKHRAFACCTGLKTFNVPENMRIFRNGLFSNCINLKEVVVLAKGADTEWLLSHSPFEFCSKDLIVYGHAGSGLEGKAERLGYTFKPLEEKTDTPEVSDETKEPGKSDDEKLIPQAKGTILTIKNKKIRVKVTSSKASNPTVAFIGSTNKKAKTISIPDKVAVDGVTYQITSIVAKACKNNKKLTRVTIGKNVTTIGKEAFFGCKKLKKITIKSKALKGVGKNAIKGINKKATIKCPKKQLAKYKKLFKSKTGYKKTMKIK